MVTTKDRERSRVSTHAGFNNVYSLALIFSFTGDAKIHLEPREDFKSAGINDVAEFHCRVSGIKNGGQEVSAL